jgi:2-phospho-L-lactate transferase/gluconeogenesis factor (CofD/UPF0052 family)
MQDGIFTQPGPNGIFGRGGEPGDASAPTVDGDGTMLRETLVVVYPSPGHMRVARAIRHPKTGKVEFQEEYRVPTPDEVELLKQQGVVAGPGSMITSQGPAPVVGGLGDAAAPPADGQPWLKLGIALVAGAAGFWAVNKWVVPMVSGGSDDGVDDADDSADEDDFEEDEVGAEA